VFPAPSVPSNLSATAVSTTQIDLSWTASTDAGSTIAGYHLYRNGSLLVTTSATSYSDIGLSPATLYTYTADSYDAAGQTSTPSSPINVRTLSATGPGFSPRAYPNPWKSTLPGNPPVTFDGLTGNSTIKIFTTSGQLVKRWSASTPSTTWLRDNDSGDRVASGLYFYVITNDQGQNASGKVVIIK
jgi:hypothetical protein